MMRYERKKKLYGYGFIALWLVGTFQYLIRPLVNIVRFSFTDIEMTETGYRLINTGIQHYFYIFRTDPNFTRNLADSVIRLFYQVPVIVAFSLVMAVILNQKFIGRTVFRTIFFIPVIVASGVIINVLNGDAMAEILRTGSRSGGSSLLQMANFGALLYNLGLPRSVIDPVVISASNVFNLAWKSGIQILILIAGLQTISPSLYEASSIEGATGWENFWKITMPMISPMLILVLVYSMIDAFTDYDNGLMRSIIDTAKRTSIPRASGMALVYFIVILAIIGIVYKIVNRNVFYMND
jgi:ABC-type sugar transport system permease subunit